MDLYQLKCFVRAYDCGSFSQAAEELFLAQTSLTYRIASLEKELGCRLFVRSKRGVAPTAAARAAYADAVEMLSCQERLLEHVRSADDRACRTIRVGFNRYPNVNAFFEAAQRYRALRPDFDMSADFSYLEDPCAALEAGTHDVVLLFDYDRVYEQYDENSRFKFVLLGEAPFSVIMAQTSPLAELESITLDDLAGQTVVSPKQFAYTKFQVPSAEELRRRGIGFDASYADNESLMLAIKLGRGVGIYPASGMTSHDGMVRRLLSDCPPLRFGLLHLEGGESGVVDDFVASVADYMGVGVPDARF